MESRFVGKLVGGGTTPYLHPMPSLPQFKQMLSLVCIGWVCITSQVYLWYCELIAVDYIIQLYGK